MILRIVPLAVLTGTFAATLALWALEREPPVVLAEEPTTETPVVRPGDTFYATFTFFRKKSCETHVDRFLIDSARVRFVVSQLDFPAKALRTGWDKTKVPAIIPQAAAPGPAVYASISTYYCNPLHRIWPIVAPVREVELMIEAPAKKGDRLLSE